jgi:hypothetical protein
MLKIASRIAIKPTKRASWVTNPGFPGITPSSIKRFNRSGDVITKTASITTVIRKNIRALLYATA